MLLDCTSDSYSCWFVLFVVLSVCKRFKDQVMVLEEPLRGVAPMLTAIRKIQTSSEHLTSLHPEFLLLCLLSKCYKAGLSILGDDIFEVDQPRDLFLYCYYGWVTLSTEYYLFQFDTFFFILVNWFLIIEKIMFGSVLFFIWHFLLLCFICSCI